MIIKRTDSFLKIVNFFVNKEIHIKLEQDENAVPYTLRATGKDFLIVDYGESQRIIPIYKILFVQLGIYPKEE